MKVLLVVANSYYTWIPQYILKRKKHENLVKNKGLVYSPSFDVSS